MEQIKKGVINNFFSVVIVVLLGFFIWQYQQDRVDNKTSHNTLINQGTKMNSRQLIVARILADDPDTDEYYRTMLLEWIKIETRGN